MKTGEIVAAREAYEQALKICRSLSDKRCIGEAANNSGYAAQQSADFEPAMERLNEAAGIWRDLKERKIEGQTLSNMGLLYWYTNDFVRAISLLDRAMHILRQADGGAYAIVLNNLGLCYQSLAQYVTARRFFEQALRIESAHADAARQAVHARLNLGRNLMLEGRPVIAQRILERTVRDAAALKYRAAEADALNACGQNFLAQHQAAAARPVLQEALKLHEAVADRRSEASDLQNLGAVAEAEGDFQNARGLFERALEIRRRYAFREAATDSLYSLANLEAGAGNWPQARQRAGEALAMLETVRSLVPGPELRASYYARKRKFFDLLVQVEMAQPSADAAERGLLAAERGRARALLDMLATGAVVSRVPADLLRRRAAIEQHIDLLSYQLAAQPAQEKVLRAQVDTAVAESEAVEARIRDAAALGQMAMPAATVAEIRRRLPVNCALIEYHLANPQSYLWLIGPGPVQVFRLPSRAALEADSRRTVNLFMRLPERQHSAALQSAFQQALQRLSRDLLGPLRDAHLPDGLVMVLDGALNQVPFAALRIPGTENLLGLKHDLMQIPAASYLLTGRQPRAVSAFPKALLGVADPVFSRQDSRLPPALRREDHGKALDLPRLPFTAELQRVMEMVPAARIKILRGFAASPDELHKVRLTDYAVLHFSTHALIDDRTPELSRIALSMVNRLGEPVDGFLTPHHLAEFELNGSTVVLSACGTALGKEVIGEGLAGLTAALFQAGAAELVLTLSEVDAESSAEFLSEVYRAFFAARASGMAHSLTVARQALAASARWSDPYYWASFVVIGHPSDIVR